MKQQEIAAIFTQFAELLEFRGESPFRIRAYQRAARQLEGFSGDLDALAGQDRLTEIPGIGADLAEKIREYLATGRIAAFEQLTRAVPAGLFELLSVPGLGPKTAKLLHDRLRIGTIAQLEAAAKAHRLRGLPGFQATKEANLLKGIVIVKQDRQRMDLGVALPLAEALLAELRTVRAVKRVSAAGSLRRMQETIGDLDLLAASTRPSAVMRAFTTSRWAGRVLAAGTTKGSILTPEGLQVDLRVVAPESFGAALQYFTGSKQHNVRLRELAVRRGLKVNEYGVFRVATNRRLAGREEADVYRALDLPWIPPELREDRGELDAAREGRLPRLVELKDVRGDFHIHSVWSDGSHEIEELAASARRRGYEYLALCDHSQSLKVAHGMSVRRLREQMALVRQLNRRLEEFRILVGSEVDILGDGSMDYPDDVLAELDFVVASIHSGFRQSEAQLTRRLIRAAEHPSVTLLGHPTGRLMGQRDAYPVDFEAVFRAAQSAGTAVEINAYPKRLDLTDVAAARARELGVMLAVSTDTHRLEQFDHMPIGLSVARRAWCEPRHLLNCLGVQDLARWLARKRRRATADAA